MGNRLAPLLAVVFMHSIECVALNTSGLLLLRRYIDDYIIIAESDIVMKSVFDLLNNRCTNIKLTMESVQNARLPFLNIELTLSSDGKVCTRWYRKPANKGIVTHATSHHPSHVKRAIIKSTLLTANAVSSAEYKAYSNGLAQKLLSKNGYSMKSAKHHKPFRGGTKSVFSADNLPVLSIPFVSDNFTNDIKKAAVVAGLNIRVVEKPSPTLLTILSNNRSFDNSCANPCSCLFCPKSKLGACRTQGAVYEIFCAECNLFYVGHTGRPLYERAAEHRRAAQNPLAASYSSNAFALHSRDFHNSRSIRLFGKILRVENSIVRRKIVEAYFINLLRPSLNNRVELASDVADLNLLHIH